MKPVISVLMLLVITGFSCAQTSANHIPEAPIKTDLSKFQHATFAAGCFWHEEALFESIKGVKEAISGYAGGSGRQPDYRQIEAGNTGYAESVTVYYDPAEVSYATLLKVYFAGQDATSVNGQSPDFGSQYRSIAFYESGAQKKEIDNYMKQLTASKQYKRPLAVEVLPLKKFWPAENFHQDFIAHHPTSPYVQNVSIPEIKQFQKEYPDLIKKDHFF